MSLFSDARYHVLVFTPRQPFSVFSNKSCPFLFTTVPLSSHFTTNDSGAMLVKKSVLSRHSSSASYSNVYWVESPLIRPFVFFRLLTLNSFGFLSLIKAVASDSDGVDEHDIKRSDIESTITLKNRYVRLFDVNSSFIL